MIESLRPRWPQLALAIALLLGLNPSGVHRPLVQSLRASRIALSSGRPDAALDSLETALALEPALGASHHQAASFALSIGDYERAQIHLDRYAELFPDDPSQRCLSAWVLLGQNDAAGAEREWRAVKEICPHEVNFLQALLEDHWTNENLVTAQAILEELIAIQPANEQLHLRLGLIIATNQPEEALPHLYSAQLLSTDANPLASALIQVIEDTGPNESRAMTLAGIGQTLARQHEWTPAIWAFRQTLTLDPDYSLARAYLGLALERTGQDGYRELRSAVAQRPTAALPRIFMSYHWLNVGEPDSARRELEIAARLDPTNPAISAELGAAYAALGDVEAAKAAFIMATDIAPRNAEFWQLLAEFSLANEIEVQVLGLPAARNATILAGHNPATFDLLGYAHLLLGNLELAERLLWRAANLQPDRPMTQFHLGLLRHMQGDLSRARAAWELAVQLDPSSTAGELSARALENLPITP
ncbi:MAG: tetratricopeptide repeat protein [Anaerolineales bacterium]|nr:tetratricopeptide repeat protein [Anaerolineales bacterium]